MSMKKSTKVWLIVFIISFVGSLLLFSRVSNSIIIGDSVYFNFDAIGYVGLVFMAVSVVSGGVLYFKFIKSQNFTRMLFFLTVPLTLTFAVAIYLISNINNYYGTPIDTIRQVLNVTPTNNINYVWAILLTIVYLILLFITFSFACKPIKKIEKAIYRLSDGKIKDDIQIGGNKQFEGIEHGLNKINDVYKEKENLIKKTNLEYEKFIPKQFLKFLGKNSILELELGNQVQKEVTTMFCDIRNSTATSSTLSLEDNFNYINSYLKVVSPLIRKHGGFVDKYLGDGVLAVFVRAEDAIECAVQIVRAIEQKNKSASNTPSMDIGISLNTGEVVFGVVGEEERKSPTIISDTVNLASKMENINKYFHTKIIFSKRTLNSLKNEYPLSYRFLGTLTLEDKDYLSLFECLDSYDKKIREKLESVKITFEQGVRYYNLGKYHNAKENFQLVLKRVREDKVAYMYYNKCEQKINGENPMRL